MALNPRNSAFLRERDRLLAIAYRLLGSHADSEDVVQEAWLRWSRSDLAAVDNVPAFLTSVVSRLCIDRLRRRRVEKLNYTGPWLPDPVPTEEDPGLRQAAFARGISMAFMVMLEQLTPQERAVFILKEAFDFSHQEIAALLDVTMANSRQLLRRARRRLGEDHSVTPDRASVERLVGAFMDAAQGGDLATLTQMFTEDAIAYTDGGGRVTAALVPLRGPAQIATVFSHLVRQAPADQSYQFRDVNGQPALLISDGNGLHSVTLFGVRAGQVYRVYTIRNPAKLAAFRSLA